MRNTLTLKSNAKGISPNGVPAPSASIQGGRQPKNGHQKACKPLLRRLTEMINSRSKVFIQMRHGTGYCGVPTLLEDGWLTMSDVSIHGTKQTSSSSNLLIQIRDGAFIAHLHSVDSLNKTGI